VGERQISAMMTLGCAARTGGNISEGRSLLEGKTSIEGGRSEGKKAEAVNINGNYESLSNRVKGEENFGRIVKGLKGTNVSRTLKCVV